MKKVKSTAIPLLQDWLEFPGKILSKTLRWGRFAPRTQKQTVFRHSFEQLMITLLATCIEWTNGHKISPLYFLACATTHDFGERGKYDDDVITKNGKNKNTIIEKERKRVYQFFNRLPIPKQEKTSVIDFLKNSYELQYKNDEDGQFFHALELLGYSSFALKQYRAGRKDFKEVLANSHNELIKASKKYKSIKLLYGQYVPEIKKILKKL